MIKLTTAPTAASMAVLKISPVLMVVAIVNKVPLMVPFLML